MRAVLLFCGVLALGCDGAAYQVPSECAGPVPDVWLRGDVQRGFAPLRVTWSGTAAPSRPWRLDLGNGEVVGPMEGAVEAATVYTAPGRHRATLTLTRSACDPETSDSVVVEVLAPVELAAASLRVMPRVPVAGEPVRLEVDVADLAGTFDGVVQVSFLFGPSGGVDWDELDSLWPLAVVPVDGLAGEQVHVVATAVMPAVLGGAYGFYAVVDLADDVGEGDETGNNVALARVDLRNSTDDPLDLRVESVRATTQVVCGRLEALSVSLDVGFSGLDPVLGNVALWLQEEPGVLARDRATRVFTSPDLWLGVGPGPVRVETGTIVLEEPRVGFADSARTLYLFACADPDDAVAERMRDGNAEANNCASTAIVLPAASPEASSVVVDWATVAPESVPLFGEVTASVGLSARSDEVLGSFFCGVYLSGDAVLSPRDDLHLTNINVSRLDVGARSERHELRAVVPDFFPVGTYQPYVVCDRGRVLGDVCVWEVAVTPGLLELTARCTDPFETEPESSLLDAVAETGLDLCPFGDFDVYFLDLVDTARVEVCVVRADDGDVTLTAFDPARRQVAAHTSPAPCVSWAGEPGRHRVRLLGLTSERTAYSLRVTVQ